MSENETGPLTVANSGLAGRPGIRTTEFWVMVGMTLLGAWLIERGQDTLGAYLIMIAGGGYTATRGLLKHREMLTQADQNLTNTLTPPGITMATPEQAKSYLTKRRPPTPPAPKAPGNPT